MDSSPAGLFDSYDQDFKHIIRGIRDKLEGSGKPERGGMAISPLQSRFFLFSCYAEQRKAALRRVEIELDEADDIASHSPFCIESGC